MAKEHYSSKKTVAFLWVAMIVYLAVAFTHAGYGIMTGTGIGGQIMSLQMSMVGRASMKLSFLLAFLVYMVPLLGMCKLIGILAPGPARAFQRSFQKQCTPPPPGADPRVVRTWKGVLTITGVLVAVTAGIAAMLYLRGRQEQMGHVHAVDLSQPVSTYRNGGNFVEITGQLARDFVSVYKERSSFHVYVPLTPEEWRSEEPVRAFVHYTLIAPSTGRPPLPASLRNAGTAQFQGELHSQLPVFIEKDFKTQGLRIEPAYVVLDWADLQDRKIPESDDHLIALGIGGMLTTVAFLMLTLIKTGVLPTGPGTAGAFAGTWRKDTADNPPVLIITQMSPGNYFAREVHRNGYLTMERPSEGRAEGALLRLWRLPDAGPPKEFRFRDARTLVQMDREALAESPEGVRWMRIAASS